MKNALLPFIATLLPGNMAYYGWIVKNNLKQQV